MGKSFCKSKISSKKSGKEGKGCGLTIFWGGTRDTRRPERESKGGGYVFGNLLSLVREKRRWGGRSSPSH